MMIYEMMIVGWPQLYVRTDDDYEDDEHSLALQFSVELSWVPGRGRGRSRGRPQM